MYLRLLFLALLFALAGCGGGTTYGTGVSQEAQLLNDVTSIASFGSREKKAPIDYSARPKLVRASNESSLPAPVDTSANGNGAFPVDPEERRANRVKTADTSADHGKRTIEGVDGPAIEKPKLDGSPGRDKRRNFRKSSAIRDRVLAARKKARGATGSGARRYLTDPPQEYRTPAETAPIGDPGEREKRERKKITNPANGPTS